MSCAHAKATFSRRRHPAGRIAQWVENPLPRDSPSWTSASFKPAAKKNPPQADLGGLEVLLLAIGTE
jgi:hypothetical protein